MDIGDFDDIKVKGFPGGECCSQPSHLVDTHPVAGDDVVDLAVHLLPPERSVIGDTLRYLPSLSQDPRLEISQEMSQRI